VTTSKMILESDELCLPIFAPVIVDSKRLLAVLDNLFHPG